MKTLLITVLFVSHFVLSNANAQNCKSNPNAGNSSGGGGDCVEAARSIPLGAPRNVVACSEGQQVEIRWQRLPNAGVTGYTIFTCELVGRKTVEYTWVGSMAAQSSMGLKVQPDPEVALLTYALPTPQDLNTKFCVAARDSLNRKNNLSLPVAISKCAAAPIVRAPLPAPEVTACLQKEPYGTYVHVHFRPTANTVERGFKVFACEDHDFKWGREPSVSKLEQHWIATVSSETNPKFQKLGRSTMIPLVEGTPPVKFCVAAFDADNRGANKRLGHISKPVVATKACY